MTRPSSGERRRADAPPAARRAIVRDYTGGSPMVLAFDTRTVYDFVVSLERDAHDRSELLPEDRRWLDDARSSLSPSLRGELAMLFGEESKGPCITVLVAAVDHPDVQTAREFLSAVEDADVGVLARWLFSDLARDADLADALAAALRGDLAGAHTLERSLTARHPEKEEWNRVRVGLLVEPDAFRSRLVRVLEAWLERFEPHEERIAGILARDVERRSKEIESMDWPTAIEHVTGGLRWLPDPGVRRTLLAPSYMARPANYTFSGDDWWLFVYPVGDAAVGPPDPFAPPPEMVRLYRALGDDNRMRVLRLLADRDHYLTELAQKLELSKPTLLHHLLQLRAAGLVTVTKEGSMSYYSLRTSRLREVGPDLSSFLRR